MVSMKVSNKTIVWLAIGLLALAVTYYLANTVVPRVLVSLTRAAPAKRVSFKQSLVLGEKILAMADGKDECVVNVFILDEEDKGVVNKRVVLVSSDAVLGIKPESGITDSSGKVAFKMASTKEGQFELKATVEGVELEKGVRVTFRN